MAHENMYGGSFDAIPSIDRQIDDIFASSLDLFKDPVHEQNLVADLYNSQNRVDIARLGIEQVILNVLGPSINTEDDEFKLQWEIAALLVKPEVFTTKGVLCCVEGLSNDFGDEEYILIEGSIVAARHEDLFADGSTAFHLDQWPDVEDKKAHNTATLSDCAVILTRHLVIGSHLSWRPTYSPEELKALQKDCAEQEQEFNVDDFSKIEDRDKEILVSTPYYSFVSPGVITGVTVHTTSGKEYNYS